MIRLISWNINGIRAGIKKGLWEKLPALSADIVSFQETKADSSIMDTKAVQHEAWQHFFHSATSRKGYSGVATLVPAQTNTEDMFSNALGSSAGKLTTEVYQVGVGDKEFDKEGRLIITRHTLTNPATPIQSFLLLNGYYPQGGRGADRVAYKIKFYEAVHKLTRQLKEQGEYLILCGDLNTTVADIDLARPAGNRKTTGCLPEEREALNLFLQDNFVDSFRYFYPDKPDMYSWWDQITRARDRNVGWRIDYFLVDKDLVPYMKDAHIYTSMMGSDHAPVGLDLEL